MANPTHNVNAGPTLPLPAATPRDKMGAVVKLALSILAAGIMTAVYYQVGILTCCAEIFFDKNVVDWSNPGSAAVVVLVAIVCSPILYPVIQAADAINTLRS